MSRKWETRSTKVSGVLCWLGTEKSLVTLSCARSRSELVPIGSCLRLVPFSSTSSCDASSSHVKGRLCIFFLFYTDQSWKTTCVYWENSCQRFAQKEGASYSRSLLFPRQSFVMFKFMLTGFARNYFVLHNSRHSKELSKQIVLKEKRKVNSLSEKILQSKAKYTLPFFSDE